MLRPQLTPARRRFDVGDAASPGSLVPSTGDSRMTRTSQTLARWTLSVLAASVCLVGGQISAADNYGMPYRVPLSPPSLTPSLPSVSPAPRVQTSPRVVPVVVQAKQQAEFVLVNSTSSWLSLFVDGRRTISVPPGDRGVTLIWPGTYRFRAQTPDGRRVERSGYVGLAGQTWTITEQ